MSEENPPKFDADIPVHLLKDISDGSKWMYEQISVHGKKADWLIDHAKRADDHRTHINKVVSDLDVKVTPAVNLAAKVTTLRGRIVAVVLLIVIPMGLAVFGAWVGSVFK